jgi:LysR family transcriptional regulator, carnitine catabolism transcriptional activator
MELRQVEYVVAVVDHGGFTRAAAALHVTQPSLSSGVATLERELGVELFHRLGRRVELTSAGEAFVPPARRLLREANSVRAAVGAVAELEAGTLDVVALPTLAAEPLAPLIGRFRSRHPGVLVRVAEPEDGRELLRMVRDGRAELGLNDLAAVGPGMVTHPLARQELFAVCPPETALPARNRRRVPAAWLAERPLITTRPGTSTRDLLDAALGRVDAVGTIAVETGQREAIVPLVLAGAGCALLPEPVARKAAEQGAVVARVEPALERTIGIVHRDEPLSPAAAAFVAVAAA